MVNCEGLQAYWLYASILILPLGLKGDWSSPLAWPVLSDLRDSQRLTQSRRSYPDFVWSYTARTKHEQPDRKPPNQLRFAYGATRLEQNIDSLTESHKTNFVVMIPTLASDVSGRPR